MEFSDLLQREGIDPSAVLVVRHRPFEPELRKVLPWLAAEHPDTFNAYQQTQQNPRVEAAFQRASQIASFFGHESGKALFLGLYRRGDWQAMSKADYWALPAYQQLKAFGFEGFVSDRETVLWFDLQLTSFYAEWRGRLVVQWPGLERSWWRRAERNQFWVDAVLPRSSLESAMPAWNELSFTWDELNILPESWKAALAQWRGIYFIFDESDARGYVGSAYGAENILGRWLSYASSGHGGNKELRRRDPSHFRFSILQRVSPDMDPGDVIRLEATWKERLHTRRFGLNEN